MRANNKGKIPRCPTRFGKDSHGASISRCPSCGERHNPKLTCLEAWLDGLKSPENNGNKAPRTRETTSGSWRGKSPLK